MINAKQLISKYEIELDQKEKQLIAQKRVVRQFLKTAHSEAATRAHIVAIEETEVRIDEVISSLVDMKSASQFRKAAEKLCRRYENLDKYTSYMNRVLSEDLEQKKKSTDKKDWVKDTTFLFGLPLSFFIAAKNDLLNHIITPDQAAGIGLAISSGVLSMGVIKTAFKATGKFICQLYKKGTFITQKSYATAKEFFHNKSILIGKKTRIFLLGAKKIRNKFKKPEI